MIADLKPYPAVKDSGVTWLGVVPEHWRVLPNRAVFAEVKERDRPDAVMLSVTITRGVIRQEALLQDSWKKDSSKLDKSAYKLVQPGDIAYNKMRAWQGAIGVSEYEGIVSPAYVVQRPREGAAPRYLHYLLRTPAFAKEAERWSYGITSDMWSLRPEHFKMIYSCLPPLPEQLVIVRLLDHADRQIRRYIRAKQKLIKLLEEQKQAIIHRAVTRGLDPNVRLKPSGVEWLGDMPEHWEVVALKRVCRLLRDGTHLPPPRTTSGIPLLSVRNIIDGRFVRRDDDSLISEEAYRALCRSFVPQEHDVLLAIVGATLGKVAIVGDMDRFHIQRSLAIFRPKAEELTFQFLSAYLCGAAFQRALWTTVAFSAQPGIYLSTLGDFSIALPPLREQDQIVRMLTDTVSDVSKAIATANKQIDLLREYRARLVADVVTGKLDVREAAARLPDEVEESEPLDEIEAEGNTDEANGDDTDAAPEEAEA